MNFIKWKGKGLEGGEEFLPEEPAGGAPATPAVDQGALDQLLTMGFSENRCRRALINTGNAGAEAAMEWLFAHMDDPGIDDPLPEDGAAATTAGATQADIDMLKDMGFSESHAKRALKETVRIKSHSSCQFLADPSLQSNNVERAVEWLFNHPDEGGDATDSAGASQGSSPLGHADPGSYDLMGFVNHKGTSVHAGHYVAHIRSGAGWALFNDNKVVQAEKVPLDDAYLLFFVRRP